MDEFHYYADRDRGVAWQIPLLTLPRATFLLMSATFGSTEAFEEHLTQLTGRPTAVVQSNVRPVELDFEYRDTPLHETLLDLIKNGRVPVYIVNFTQRACAEEAQNLMSTDYSTKDEKKAIAAALEGQRFDSPYGREVQRFVRHGIGLHHAGLLPKYRLLVEKLAQKGHLKVICGTDTLGVGVNIPIRTVLFTRLCKFDGEKTAILSVRDFRQISGRAGRKGFDDRGSVVVQAPEHVIENLRLEQKAGADPVKKRRIVRKKPPEKGYVHWDRATFDRLLAGKPEPLVSRFQVTHAMLLNVLARPAGGCKAMVKLVRSSHENAHAKRQLRKQGLLLYKSLLDAKIIEIVPREEDGSGRRIRINADLQDDFSLNHALSLYLHETVDLLDRESPEYPLQLLTLVESILENPDLILMKQLDRLKGETIAKLKAEGVEYEQRMEAIEKLEYPKPHREFIYGTFNEFAARHPWVGAADNIRPKSIAREMYEQFLSFGDYVKDYELQRAEGLVLRYLSDVYKALVQNVPDRAKDEEVDEIITYFRAIVKQVDSSLLDEWERMRDPTRLMTSEPRAAVEEREKGITSDVKAFTVLVRNEMFHLLKELAARDYAAAAARLAEGGGPEGGGEAWTPEGIEAALLPYFEEHATIRLDPAARSPKNTMLDRGEHRWGVKQIVVDPEEDNDWVIEGAIDLARSDAAGRAVIGVRRIGT
jgi:Domain of unknown function (DUF3516)/Helicase conserved C-terminal domain